MTIVSIEKLANDVNTTVERIIQQFSDAGIQKGPHDNVSEEDKRVLLDHLSKAHGSIKSPDKLSKISISKRTNSAKDKVRPETRKSKDHDERDNIEFARKSEKEAEINEKLSVPSLTWKRGDSHFVGDLAGPSDALGRSQLSSALVNFIDGKDYSGEMTIGLLGNWGIGKTTLIELIREQLSMSKQNTWLHANFNAWEYEHSDNIQAGVAQEAVSGLVNNLSIWNRVQLLDIFSRAERKWLYRLMLVLIFVVIFTLLASTSSFLWETLFGKVSLLIALGGIITLMRSLLLLPFASVFNTYLRLPHFGKELGLIPLMKKHIATLSQIILEGVSSERKAKVWQREYPINRTLRKLKEYMLAGEKHLIFRWFFRLERWNLRYYLPKNPRRLLYVVDDLDRCSAEGIIKVFEAVRLVMQQPHVTVLIAVDQNVALPALACHYEELSKHHSKTTPTAIARDYLGKIIQLPIILTEPTQKDTQKFISNVLFTEVFSFPKTSTEGIEKNQDETNIPEEKPFEMEAEAKKNQVTGFSENEKEHFIILQDVFGFHNPRQLKRLFNGYNLMRFYSNEYSEIVEFKLEHVKPLLEWMTMIFTLEYLNSTQATDGIYTLSFWEDFVVKGVKPNENFDKYSINLNRIFDIYINLNEDISELKAKYLYELHKSVKPFVLPAL
ncbi:translation initiation factor IF-2 N-terminal domain-containing protein [Rheinheimera sp. 1928-s]|uniref:translation initiation factor IF-2 N-terminal domain-containing protein n=1 Tax=Rheinheimera sp. 1928-s TaxID=3033803 RepID=UPI002623847B|nr:translation initiation factor IF-2 N-terminal domain-containing protein [Rheinheimera sp. 1928-s]MDF3123477.1 translation initiation factor IF-2 N-terminal domain-containing protein [Rheinheimera sp. 1928-s]